MTKTLRILLSFITIWFCPTPGFISNLFGQDAGLLTLEQCIAEALNNNPSSAYAQMSENVAAEDVAVARSKYYPEVGFQTGLRRWETHAFLPEGLGGENLPSHIGPINDWQFNVRTNYMLFDSGSRSSDLKTAQAQLMSAKEESKRTKADLIYRVQSAFFQVLQAEDAIQLAKERVSRSKHHLKLAEQRKEAGAVPKSDVTRSRTEVASAELDVASAEGLLRIAIGRLNEAMGRDASQPLRITRSTQTLPDPSTWNLQETLQQAVEKRPEVLAMQQRVEAKRSQIGGVRSEILPKLRAEAGYGWRDDDFDQVDKDWWVGVTLNIPLFDGGVRSHRIAKSKMEANREAQLLAQVKLSVQEEVWSAYSEWIEAFQAVQTSGIMKEEATESLSLVNARYEEGASTISELLDAELSLNQSETQVNNARYRVHIAYAAFRRAAANQ